MQNFIAGLLLASCAVPLFAGSMTIASSLSHDAPSHQFTNLDAEPLWTSEVKRIDVNKQAYERLPAVIAPETLVAEAKKKAAPSLVASNDETQMQMAQDRDQTFDISEQAKNWCAAKYRSYSAEDNSYQPYGGGDRKPCVAPTEIAGPATIQTAAVSEDISGSDHVQWCMERYSSYRVEDNSYQPFSGPRKKCLPPQQQSASNRYAVSDQQLYQ
ncbi:BA14K family protein [Agrobacterium larrymoorei]|uniref:Lectin-like protein BA14k n=1 Tax=Agrobacterium larrymoorei TaxID=160699 RepID=A0A4D7E0K3_9HYPH|nr:BA14K family protein [Agrobacterium larrymoorei]QCJ00825.1 hypothetical protein CFBP5473_22880 [Agrobacterium larrymoorei]QYA10489.1 BA14K family protein [Agrobacterium larrymoorei]